MNNIIIYGAYGYTGKLIVAEAVKKGWKPTVAGRNEALVKALADKYDLPFASFDYDDQTAWDNALTGKDLLLNCAGPFSLTIAEILPVCIRNKTHYTDITGEIEVFEYIQSNHQQAKDAGIVMMPGTGFDVVPTDCLAKYLCEQLPTASHLELAFESASGLSRGTALSVLNRFHKGSAIREGGVVKEQPAVNAYKIIRYHDKDRLSVGIAWGDVFTAYHSTGIPNIQVFTGMSEKLMKIMRRAGKWSWLIKTGLVQKVVRYFIRKKIDGPSAEKRESLQSHLWGKVSDENGNEVQAQMVTPEGYKLTAITAVLCAEKILNGETTAGYHTPAGAFGSGLIMEVDGVVRNLI
ncbi:MAG: short subunit dehydrogenase-like uncharacterized protein [Bacteroidia bacterium]|jgi:short subunit dehydrogenase-like uncharacterized protein